MGDNTLNPILLVVLVLALWALYFALCGAPLGTEFIYADF